MELDRSILLNHPEITQEVKNTYRAIWAIMDRIKERERHRLKQPETKPTKEVIKENKLVEKVIKESKMIEEPVELKEIDQ